MLEQSRTLRTPDRDIQDVIRGTRPPGRDADPGEAKGGWQNGTCGQCGSKVSLFLCLPLSLLPGSVCVSFRILVRDLCAVAISKDTW